MKRTILISFLLFSLFACSSPKQLDIGQKQQYLSGIKTELIQKWPKNKTINLVFHGHSVPAGYFKTPHVNTIDAYPYQLLVQLKKQYPHAVINIINTAIGGENAASGAKRFNSTVLVHQPDVLFIDYALNDLGIGLEKAEAAWGKMIKQAQNQGIRIILLTPTPNLKIDILDDNSKLAQHQQQIRNLAKDYGVGLVDVYAKFKEKAKTGEDLTEYMSQGNHPNAKGHALVAKALLEYFK